MKYKVSELEGALLDAAVAMAEGLPFRLGSTPADDLYNGWPRVTTCWHGDRIFSPWTDWALGGPIMERERIAPQPDDVYEWIPPQIGETYLISPANPNGGHRGRYLHTRWRGGFSREEPNRTGFGGPTMTMCYSIDGSTMLECAMREHVGRKFGPEIDLPTTEVSPARQPLPRAPTAAT